MSRVSRQPSRGIAILSCAALLAGCSSQPDWLYAQYFQVARQSLDTSLGRQRISRDEAAAVPYASLGYRLDGGAQNLLVLASDTDGEQLWTAKSKVVIALRGGRIIRTVGLPRDTVSVTPQAGGTLPSPAQALAAPFTSRRLADFPDIAAYGVPLFCSARTAGPETVVILGSAMPLTRVDEFCRSTRPRWSFTDSYWIAPDSGLVWRSRQHIHPKGETVEIELFRPPG